MLLQIKEYIDKDFKKAFMVQAKYKQNDIMAIDVYKQINFILEGVNNEIQR